MPGPKPTRRPYTDQQLRDAVHNSLSVRSVCLLITGNDGGSARRDVLWRIESLGVNTSHFLGQSHFKGRPTGLGVPLDTLLVRGTERRHVKQRLFTAALKEKKCESCDITDWQGQPAPLELDHINGDACDNRIENLRILCANCHAQTSTYKGKNKGKSTRRRSPTVEASGSKSER
jgi:hypothetical protein